VAITGPLPVKFDDVFPMGACVLSVGPVYDFEKSTKQAKVPALDRETGLPVWAVDVLDLDDNARIKDRAVTVKIAAPVQPVPPEVMTGTPLRPVEFDGLAVRAYVNANNRIAWSISAKAMRAPSVGTKPRNASGDSDGKAA
jgi:hypothetical protein